MAEGWGQCHSNVDSCATGACVNLKLWCVQTAAL